MHLSPQERDKLLVHVAADVARARKARGLRMNYPEAVALITDHVLEGARDGRSGRRAHVERTRSALEGRRARRRAAR